jgi:hypothetical protein
MAIEAYAVEEHGALLVDTVRFLPGDAKQAAQKLRKWPGDWRSMERAGFALIRVYVQVSGHGKRPAPGRRFLVNPHDMTPDVRARLRRRERLEPS